MAYNEKLHYFLKSKNMTKKKMAEMLQVNETMLGRYMSGDANFPPLFLSKLISVFPEVDLNYIFSDEKTSIDQVAEEGNDYPKIINIKNDIVIIYERLERIKKALQSE